MGNKLSYSVLFSAILIGVISLFSFNFFYFGKNTVKEFKEAKAAIEAERRGDNFVAVTPSLESIFAEDHSWTATLSAQRKKTILVTGDVIPARSVNAGVLSRNNTLWPYENVQPLISSLAADLVFTNLETPLLKDCPVTQEGMIFCGSKRNIEGLTHIGVDLVSVANNHFGNFGKKGIDETIELLKAANMSPVGIGDPVYKDIRGTKFAFLAYNDIEKLNLGINNANETLISEQIALANKNADATIVMFHWGAEYNSQPDKRQVELAYYAIDHGADLVVSNHPHWIQPVELYKNKLIMYAHGNFIFDQMWSEKTKQGVLGLYTFYDEKLIDIEYFPIYIKDYGQAVVLDGDDKKKILGELKTNSDIRAKNALNGN